VRAFDRERPDITVVIMGRPTTALLQAALSSGAPDVISPDISPLELRAALERAFESARLRRSAFDWDGDGDRDVIVDDRRVVMCLCPNGGAGKTRPSSAPSACRSTSRSRAPGRSRSRSIRASR
jgi:hypothetical protein